MTNPNPSRFLLASLLFIFLCALPRPLAAQTIRVDSTASHVANSFSPLYALGSTVDRVPSNATDPFFKPEAIRQILSAGWGQISYRQNTELFVQAWHWNPKGTWSDPAGKGYFTSDATPTEMIRHSYGYSLPHRGFTRNGGTEDDGYSRLTDGDTSTYWKSNPYLTHRFTQEEDALHPQWVVIDLESSQLVNAIRIDWAEPFATSYQLQYWAGTGDAMDEQGSGDWKTFSSGVLTSAKGGIATLRLEPQPIQLRYVRILMTQSSNTCDTHGSSDPRNCVGYAIKELYLGTLDASQNFKDLLRHTPGQKQSATFCSSVDPWHEPSNLYVAPDRMESGDQPGLDLFYTSGITRGLPPIMPVAMLYGIPEDSVAQIAYIKKRGYPISLIEMGEEPDGQYMVPEDYGALYLQWASALHALDPSLKLGGPAFQGVTEDIKTWRNAQGQDSWFARFLIYLNSHHRLADFSFMSFEHYPYDGCETPWENLYQEPELITHIMQVWRNDGLPPTIPMLDTETNAHGGEAAVDIFGALWIADSFAGFLTAGGQGTYYYHDLPYSPAHPICPNSWGTYHMFMVDQNYEIDPKRKTSQYFAAQLITQEWVQPKDEQHRLFRAASDVKDPAGHTLVTAYPVLRPDGQWSLLIINKDHDQAHPVRILFHDSDSNSDLTFTGPVAMLTFGKNQYQWHPNRKQGYPDPDGPAVASTLQATPDSTYTLPPASVTVLRGKIVAPANP